MLFVITGPSGCGKTTLIRRILKEVKNTTFSVSHTTRKMRKGEKEGKDYYFVSRSEFQQMIRENKFIEWAVVHGNYYGTSKSELKKRCGSDDLIFDIDVQGARQMKEKLKKAVFIFILPPMFEELRRRLKKRGEESEEAIEKRMEVAKKEISHYPNFDFIVINDQLERAVEELKSIIICMRCQIEARKKEIIPILQSFSRGD